MGGHYPTVEDRTLKGRTNSDHRRHTNFIRESGTIHRKMHVFISYSHKDKSWLQRLQVHLRPLEREAQIEVWADTRIKPGEKWIQEIEGAIASANIAVLLVSADFLASEFIASNELPRLLRAAQQRACTIIPIIVSPCRFQEIKSLEVFQAVNPPSAPLNSMNKSRSEAVLVKVADTIHALASEPVGASERPQTPSEFAGSPEIEALIGDIKIAEWNKAMRAALKVVSMTDAEGKNALFESLLDYQDCPTEDDRFWGAIQTIECTLRLAPQLINHSHLSRMAAHQNFSVRSPRGLDLHGHGTLGSGSRSARYFAQAIRL